VVPKKHEAEALWRKKAKMETLILDEFFPNRQSTVQVIWVSSSSILQAIY
jgi:hypothetical protein